MHAQTQAFMKLAQSNMDLLTRLTTSSEVSAQASTNPSQMFQKASESAMRLLQPGTFAEIMQGMLRNYTEFLSEVSHGGLEMLSQGQAAMTRQIQDANSGIVEVTAARGRRARKTS